MQYSQYQQPRSDLKLDQNPYFSQKMFLKIGFFSVFFVGMGLRFVKNQHFLYQNVRLDEAHFLSERLTTKFQRLWRQNQAQRYPSSKNRVFHVYDSPTLAWLALLVFAIVNLMSDQLLV